MGMTKILMDHSDKMWARAQKIVHFMLHRGSKTSDLTNTMKLSNINPTDFAGEVRALAHTLTNLKSITEDIYAVHKHANNRHDHANPTDNSYDPSVRCRVTRCGLLPSGHPECKLVPFGSN